MITGNQLEQDCLAWFREGGWETVFGPDIAHDGVAPERADYREVVLVGRLSRTLARLVRLFEVNPLNSSLPSTTG